MGKPSIFSGDYHKVMRRRKRIFRLSIVLIAVCLIFLFYSRSAIPGLKKIIQGINLQSIMDLRTDRNKNEDVKKQDVKDNPDANATSSTNSQPQAVQNESTQGGYEYKFPNGETIAIKYKKDGEKVKLTGISPSNSGISFDISEAGDVIVFDNPRISDIWLFSSDGKSRKISPDLYKQLGDGGEVFNKSKVMEQFQNHYVWAARPKFLKDGRIIYQSYLPWFRETNNYYLWVCDGDGSNNRLILDTECSNPTEYIGFTTDNLPIITINNVKYVINIDQRSKQAAN